MHHRRTHDDECLENPDPPEIKKSSKRRKPPKKSEKSEKKPKDQAGEIKEKRKRKPSNSSSSSIEGCDKTSIFAPWGKHKPQKPNDETQKQINLLKVIAVERKDCTCFTESEKELIPICFENEGDAKLVIFNEVKLLDEGKSQLCSAYSVLEKNGKYLILITNSCHSKQEDEIVKGVGGKMLRPAVEPDKKDFAFNVSGKKPVIYSFSCCDVCSKNPAPGAIILGDWDEEEDDEETDYVKLVYNKLEESKLKDFVPSAKKNIVCNGLLKKSETFDPLCQMTIACQIQPNKTSARVQVQQGWTLHHSEMECLVFAKRRGWRVVAIYIDRDCCPVCASTISAVDRGIYDRICSFHTLKQEMEPSEEKSEGKVSKKKKARIGGSASEDDEELEEKGEDD